MNLSRYTFTSLFTPWPSAPSRSQEAGPQWLKCNLAGMVLNSSRFSFWCDRATFIFEFAPKSHIAKPLCRKAFSHIVRLCHQNPPIFLFFREKLFFSADSTFFFTHVRFMWGKSHSRTSRTKFRKPLKPSAFPRANFLKARSRKVALTEEVRRILLFPHRLAVGASRRSEQTHHQFALFLCTLYCQ